MFSVPFTSPIGIEITDEGIYAAQVKRGRDGIAVRGLWSHDLQKQGLADDGDHAAADAELVDALSGLAHDKTLAGRRAVISLPPGQVLSFPLRIRLQGTEELEAAILREAAPKLPFPVEEALLEYPSVESVTGTHNVVILAVHRPVLDRYLSAAQKAGLVPEVVDDRACALTRLHRELPPEADSGRIPRPAILCHIGLTHSTLAIVTADSVLAVRDVKWGSRDLADLLMKSLDLPDQPDKAAYILAHSGLSFGTKNGSRRTAGEGADADQVDSTVYQLLAPVVDGLIHEYHSLAGYVRSERAGTTFEKMVLYGHALLVKNLDLYIGAQINLPVQLVKPFTRVTSATGGPMPDACETAPYALALGLALREVSWL